MEGLLPLVAIATLYILLHMAVAAYLYRATEAGERESAAEYLPRPDPDERTVDGAGDRVPCPTCGTPNDPTYRFCRRCVADLRRSVASARGADGGKRLGS